MKKYGRMKKVFRKGMSLFLAAGLLLSVSGCGSPEEAADQSGTAQTAEEPSAAGGAGEDVAVSSKIDSGGDGISSGGADSGALSDGEDSQADSQPGGAGGSQPDGTGKGSQNGANSQPESAAVADFGLRLLGVCMEKAKDPFPPGASMPQDVYAEIEAGKNVLISPLSIISALAMTGGALFVALLCCY